MSKEWNIQDALRVAVEAARQGGLIVREYFGKTMHITMKRGIEEQIPVDTGSERPLSVCLTGNFLITISRVKSQAAEVRIPSTHG